MLSSVNILCSWISLDLACFRLVAIYFLFTRHVVVLSYVDDLDCWVGVVWVIFTAVCTLVSSMLFSKFNPAVANRPRTRQSVVMIAWCGATGMVLHKHCGGRAERRGTINRAKHHLRGILHQRLNTFVADRWPKPFGSLWSGKRRLVSGRCSMIATNIDRSHYTCDGMFVLGACRTLTMMTTSILSLGGVAPLKGQAKGTQHYHKSVFHAVRPTVRLCMPPVLHCPILSFCACCHVLSLFFFYIMLTAAAAVVILNPTVCGAFPEGILKEHFFFSFFFCCCCCCYEYTYWLLSSSLTQYAFWCCWRYSLHGWPENRKCVYVLL